MFKQTMHVAAIVLTLVFLVPSELRAAEQDQPATAETAVGKLAATMKPGEWAELKTVNLVETLWAKGNSGAIFGYNEGAVWDPASRQVLYLGGDHNDLARFVVYEADSNTWKIMPQPQWLGKGTTHGYDHNAIDAGRGVFYYRPFSSQGGVVHRYEIAAGKWTSLPKIDTPEYLACCIGLAWFPELDSLVFANGGGGKGHVFVFSQKDQKWSMPARDLPMGVYHNFAEYSSVHKVVLFGGGNSSRDLYKLDAAGKVTTLRQAPIGIGTMQTIVTLDPVSGDFLVFGKGGSFHIYDVTTDTWKEQGGDVPIFSPTRVADNKVWHVTAAPVSTYGVTLFAKYYHADPPRAWVYLYKHSAKPAAEDALAWVEPMKKVRARFTGTPGTLALFGDSITVSLAFWAPLRGEPKNMPAEMAAAHRRVKAYLEPPCWNEWRGPQYGNNGRMTIRWAHENVDTWLKAHNPEAAVVMFGTNDLDELELKEFEQKTAEVVDRCLDNGTVVLLTTLPPRSGLVEKSKQYAEAVRRVARQMQVPLIDYHAEVLKRRPDDWDGSLPKFKDVVGSEYEVPTLIARDGVHPSNPQAHQDFSEQSLERNGYLLRNYLTLLAYAEVAQKVLSVP